MDDGIEKSVTTHCSNSSQFPLILNPFWSALKSKNASTCTNKMSCIIVGVKPGQQITHIEVRSNADKKNVKVIKLQRTTYDGKSQFLTQEMRKKRVSN